MLGYAGRVLRVDLDAGRCRSEALDPEEAGLYLGGSGLAARLLEPAFRAGRDPLAPESLLVFAVGPFTGTAVPTSGRYAVAARSPLTGLWGEADSGGRWGAALKRAGFDAVVISGRSPRPVYIWIKDGEAEVRDASHLWGEDTYHTESRLREETSPRASVAAIGQAGENLVRFAAIINEGRDGRAAARCGLGAVMGSKQLKAVVADGSRPVAVADPRGLLESVKGLVPAMREKAAGLTRFGTSGGMAAIEKLGDLPLKNWQQGSWPEGAEKLSGPRMAETILTGNYHCEGCVIGCGRVVTTEYQGRPVAGAGPEYETLACLGALCLVDDLEAVACANELCNRYGLDTISMGAVAAFAIEAAERGLLSGPEIRGHRLAWGDAGGVLSLISDVALRRGLGDLLAEGVKRAADRLGRGARELAVHTKGLELPGHDPRAYNSVGLAYATSNRGACHLQAFSHVFERALAIPELGYPEVQDRFGVEGKGRLVARLQDLMAVFDSLKLCKFSLMGGVTVTHVLEWYRQTSGQALDVTGLLAIGERIFNLKRMYNVWLGVDRSADTLPPRVLKQPRGEGGAAQNLPPLETMLDEYYQERGWSPRGIPLPATLDRLGLGWAGER